MVASGSPRGNIGPVLAVMKATTVTDALEMVNSTNYALTGGIYSRSPVNLALARERFDVGNLRQEMGSGCSGPPFHGLWTAVSMSHFCVTFSLFTP
jgi:acyl-CoA reductase-like NAD-dependent aldehyde dehydrogenase